jgi:hypothetical protein
MDENAGIRMRYSGNGPFGVLNFLYQINFLGGQVTGVGGIGGGNLSRP